MLGPRKIIVANCPKMVPEFMSLSYPCLDPNFLCITDFVRTMKLEEKDTSVILTKRTLCTCMRLRSDSPIKRINLEQNAGLYGRHKTGCTVREQCLNNQKGCGHGTWL